MRLQELLNLPPAQSFLVHLSIAHCIARLGGADERWLDGGKRKFNERGGLGCVVASIDGTVVP